MNTNAKCCEKAPKDWQKTCREMNRFIEQYYEALELNTRLETSPLKFIEMKAILGALENIKKQFFNLML